MTYLLHTTAAYIHGCLVSSPLFSPVVFLIMIAVSILISWWLVHFFFLNNFLSYIFISPPLADRLVVYYSFIQKQKKILLGNVFYFLW